jgi:DNA-binding transcriptional regulator YhcF (GntR family)
LEEGLKLPSVRNLSKQLEVSLVTVVKAYKQLEQDGFVTSIQGKGTFVKAKIKEKKREKEAISSYDWQLSLQDYLPRSQCLLQNRSADLCKGKMQSPALILIRA